MTVSYILCCKKTNPATKNIHKRVNAILFHLYKILKLAKLLYELEIRAAASLSRVTRGWLGRDMGVPSEGTQVFSVLIRVWVSWIYH